MTERRSPWGGMFEPGFDRIRLSGGAEGGPEYSIEVAPDGGRGEDLRIRIDSETHAFALEPGELERLDHLLGELRVPLEPPEQPWMLTSGYTLRVARGPCSIELHWQRDAPAEWDGARRLKRMLLEIAHRHYPSYAYH